MARARQDQTKQLPRDGKARLVSPVPANSPELGERAKNHSGEVRKKIAEDLGVSEHVVRQALNVQKEKPELLKEVARGKIKLRDAAKQVKAKKPAKPRKKRPPVFHLEKCVTRAVRSVDKILDRCPEAQRDTFLSEVNKTLKGML